MAIKNINLGGGSNWAALSNLSSTDLNDTFDAAANKIKSLSTFWLNSYLYTVYDDFESYSVGNMATNTNWTVTITPSGSGGTHTCAVASSTTAGGTGKELVLTAQPAQSGGSTQVGTVQIASKLIPLNSHVFARLAVYDGSNHNAAPGSEYYFSLDGSTWYSFISPQSNMPAQGTLYAEVKIIARGSNYYDAYVGGYKVANNVNVPAMKLYIKLISTTVAGYSGVGYIYLDDVRISQYTA